VDRRTQDQAERRFVNVVEEMAIASGIPVPAIYVLAGEPGINAFAAGFTPDRAAVAVTRGALDELTREELQGVVAHELSHVLNADSRLDLQLIAAVGGLTVLALAGRVLLRGSAGRVRARGRRGGGLVLGAGLALWAAGSIGAFFGRLIRLAVSRQREFLADAAAVQFTRNPDGLAAALAKIALRGSRMESPEAPEAAHLLFANGLRSSFLSTHPPIEERIRRIAPQGVRAPAAARWPAPGSGAAGAPSGPPAPVPAGAAGLAPVAAPAAVAAARGAAAEPLASQAARGAEVLARLPAALAEAAREPFAARALAAALFADADAAVRERQLAALGSDEAALAEVRRLFPAAALLSREDRMALLELTLPALDALSAAQAGGLARDLAALAAADGHVTVFEWAVQRIVRRRLAPALGERRAKGVRARSLEEVRVEVLDVLSTLAWLGGRDAPGAQAALDQGVRALGIQATWRLLPRDRVGGSRLDAALAQLDAAAPAVKDRLLAACSACALADGRVVAAEGEVIRAVAASLGCPAPPLAPPAQVPESRCSGIPG
jgi:Zn-dependent protease with chaperone function